MVLVLEGTVRDINKVIEVEGMESDVNTFLGWRKRRG